MSDQRRIVPSETPRACAACEVESPSGLWVVVSIHLISAVSGGLTSLLQDLHKISDGMITPQSANATMRA